MRTLWLVFLAGILLSGGMLSAQSYSVHLHRLDGDGSTLAQIVKPPTSFAGQLEAFSYARNVVPLLQEVGFLEASADSIAVSSAAYDIYIHLGKKWQWAKLSLHNVPAPILLGTGITEAQFAGRPLTPTTISRLSERVLHWCEDNGYPFARVGLDSLREDSTNDGISANLLVESGSLRRIDTIIVEGDVKISRAFLMRYLDVFEGSPYNESHIRAIPKRLRNLPFIQESISWSVSFRKTDTRLYLNLRERRANQLNAIIGLQPNTLETGKFLLTVDAQAAFQNLLGNGESFSFSYQKLQAASPRIKAEALYPYLFGTQFGADGHFDLYFNGTQFRRTTFDIGARYALLAQDFFRVYYRGYNNRIISPDTFYIRTYHRLPENIDISSGGGGTEFQANRTDYRLNPSRGWQARISGEILNRSIQKNDGVTGITDGTGFDFTTLYDTVSAQKGYQYHVNADAAVYFPIKKRVIIKAAYAGGWISGERLFQNELYQIGGFRLLRGFDEGSIFANQYHIITAELRLILSRNSNVYLFSDNAWLQSNINGFANEGIYNGFGLGTQLETKTGQFTIAYGLGRSPDNPVQLRQSKVHIGYVAYF